MKHFYDNQLQDGSVLSCDYLVEEAVYTTFDIENEETPLYQIYKNDYSEFENFVEDGDISPLTKFLFDEEGDEIERILDTDKDVNDTNVALENFIESIYDGLVDEFQHKRKKNKSVNTDKKKSRRKRSGVKTREVIAVPCGNYVVRGNIFHCMHEGHGIQDVKAAFSVRTKSGTVTEVTVSASYCEVCKLFFIMDSVWGFIRSKGRPLCKIVEYDTYRMDPYKYERGMGELKPESILSEFGYSVSAQKGLSAKRRHKILKNLIDREVLSRQEIISYLEGFIRLRKYDYKCRAAISKWKEDISFVSQYHPGDLENGGHVKKVSVRRK